jgi:DNA-binding NarL/FixJ family response regulator
MGELPIEPGRNTFYARGEIVYFLKEMILQKISQDPPMSSRPIRVLVVDDHPAVRAGIKDLLAPAEDITVIGEAEDGGQAIELAGSLQPDVMLLDVEMPVMRGDMVMRHIGASQPGLKVLAVSSHNDPTYIQTMLEYGAAGYITKEEAPEMLAQAIRKICEEDVTWISPKARQTYGQLSIEEQTLTKREVDILENLLLDRDENEIAASLSMDAKQVGKHLRLLMQKFEAKSLEALKRVARRVLSRKP